MKIVFIFFLMFQFSFSQKREEIISKIAEETCSCIENKKEASNSNSYESLKVITGVCILENYQKLSSKLKSKDKIDLKNREELLGLGREVGIRMVKFCPNFILEVGEKKPSYDDEISKENSNSEPIEAEEDPFVTGVVFEIKANQFISFSIKETSGRTIEFILLNDFDNSFLLTEKLLKPNDIVDVYYYESDLFDVKVNKYVAYKVITDIIKK